MLSRQLLVQLFWAICNTMKFKQTWFHILLHRIHFLKSFSQSQSNFNVDSNSDSVLAAMWSATCDPHWFPSPLGRATLCFCSSRGLMEIHGTVSIHWAELGHHRAFSRSALQSRPYRACPPVYVVLLLLVFFWFLNHYVGESVWTLENCSSTGAKKEQPYTAETVRGYVYPGGLGTLKGLWMTKGVLNIPNGNCIGWACFRY